MKSKFVILWGHGPAWDASKTVREQAYWDEHAEFMDALFAQGMVLMGGPFTDGSGSLVVVEMEGDEAAVWQVFAKDPFVVQRIFALGSLKQWNVFLDARNVPSPQ